jgi:molybdopterin-binding protein
VVPCGEQNGALKGENVKILEGTITHVESGNTAIAVTLDQDHGPEIRIIIQSKDIKALDLFIEGKRIELIQNDEVLFAQSAFISI